MLLRRRHREPQEGKASVKDEKNVKRKTESGNKKGQKAEKKSPKSKKK